MNLKRRMETGFGVLFYKTFYEQIPYNVRNKANHFIRQQVVDDKRLYRVLDAIYNKLTDDLKEL